jgi:hypothetical protein
MQYPANKEALPTVRTCCEQSVVEAFRERVAMMIYDGGLSEFDATRAAYFEVRRAGGNVPTAVSEEWKRVGRLIR